ncbi:dTDP-4-amino-4,6-dideoxy-D-galactose acyltransferase [Franconibacter sp. IITDAS19]|uniref:dTDP-4-amino-4,6-dideoxy-D-galactose acyltransferase n=1 Tax=Franconibacter sp. IITDAS19 TaxID=2930569 RepID=UPI001FF70159|nr:dTDP-4-amino-4,6-dideoxy-D-galactose acyltransferase [Franconibacter sp. IITDAS19]MCK1970964.1 dTDP-4-amino-4,6-dideoxy-D-galactose acyltransferase [Franconibacter sp. IITDAS19]
MTVKATLAPLDWESHFFGLRSAIMRFADEAPVVDISQLDAWQRVQAKVPAQRADLLDALQQLGFQLVEGEVDLVLPVAAASSSTALSVAQEEDVPALRAAAAAVFAQSRFRAPWYPADASGQFYAQWVENAVKGAFDHACLIMQAPDGSLRGFVTLRQLNEQEARIGLLAGRSIGEILMQAAQEWCATRGLSTLRVATQVGNIAALRRYIQSGANVESTAYWLYR